MQRYGSNLNTLKLRQNDRHFTDKICKCIFLKENVWILLKISLKFVTKVRINNIPALVQNMASFRPGNKPLSEPTMVSLLTHICVTRPQWVKSIIFKLVVPNNFMDIYSEIALRWITQNLTDKKSILVQAMAWCDPAKHIWADIEPDLCQHLVYLCHHELDIMSHTRKLTVTLKIYKPSDAKIYRLLLNHAAPNTLVFMQGWILHRKQIPINYLQGWFLHQKQIPINLFLHPMKKLWWEKSLGIMLCQHLLRLYITRHLLVCGMTCQNVLKVTISMIWLGTYCKFIQIIL